MLSTIQSNLQNITDSSLVHISTEMALSIVRNTIIFNSIYLLLLLYLCIQLLVFFHRGPKPTYLCFICTDCFFIKSETLKNKIIHLQKCNLIVNYTHQEGPLWSRSHDSLVISAYLHTL